MCPFLYDKDGDAVLNHDSNSDFAKKKARNRTVDTDALMALHPPFHFTLCAFIHPAEVVVVVDLAPHDGHLVLLLL